MTGNGNQRPGLKLTKDYYKSPEENATDQPQKNNHEAETIASIYQKHSHSEKDLARVRRHRLLVTIGWLIFALLAAPLIYMRFISGIPGIALPLLKQYGMIAVGIAYLISILLALKDNMFDGLLALVVPFYPFYYLFFNSGSVLFRALTAALLAAFGFDCLMLLQNMALKIIDRISYWIQHV